MTILRVMKVHILVCKCAHVSLVSVHGVTPNHTSHSNICVRSRFVIELGTSILCLLRIFAFQEWV